MSKSYKARYGTNCKFWKDTLNAGRCAAISRAAWKRIGARSERRAGVASKVNRRVGVRSLGRNQNPTKEE